jgi:DNA-directed RNA polymerase specialized sigma24 family protein
MSTDDDFTAYVGTHWSTLVRTALLLGSDPERAESVVAAALVRSYQHWARVWQDDTTDVEVLTQLLDGIYAPLARGWRGEKAEPGQVAAPVTADDGPDRAPDHAGPDRDGPDRAPDNAGPEPDQVLPALTVALTGLPPLLRDVLVLRYVAEQDELGIADVLAVRPATVQHRLQRALAAVRPGRPGRVPTEQELVGLVEQHRQDQAMSLPPPDLVARAHDVRRERRRRTTAVTGGVLAGIVLVSGAVHVVRTLVHDSPTAAAATSSTGAPPPWAVDPSGRAGTRLVGLNGWALRVPTSWGTDQVGCDGVTAARPTVLFTALLTPAQHDCPPGLPMLFVRIGDQRFAGVPWRTISGVPVLRQPHVCGVCASLRVPSAGVSFQIRAANGTQLHRIARTLQPLSPRQVTVPIGTSTAHGRAALDQMVTVATGQGLRPRVLEVPARKPPGTFLFSVPPIGTPVDLGRSITLFFSAGDLGRYATTASLRRHGWRIFGVAVARSTYGRPAAVHAALGRAASPTEHPTFLRTLTITHEGPRRVVVRRRLVWLVVSPTRLGDRGAARSITAVDATTGHVIEQQRDLRGRVPMAVR